MTGNSRNGRNRRNRAGQRVTPSDPVTAVPVTALEAVTGLSRDVTAVTAVTAESRYPGCETKTDYRECNIEGSGTMDVQRGRRGAGRGRGAQRPDWDVAVVDGQPEMIVNAAMVRALLSVCPVGPVEGRRRLLAAGFPEHLLDEPDDAA